MNKRFCLHLQWGFAKRDRRILPNPGVRCFLQFIDWHYSSVFQFFGRCEQDSGKLPTLRAYEIGPFPHAYQTSLYFHPEMLVLSLM